MPPRAGGAYKYVDLVADRSFSNATLCPGIKIGLDVASSHVKLSSNGHAIRVVDQEGLATEAIVGDLWGNKRCFTALKVAQGQVNESYQLYEMFAKDSPRQISGVTLTNPDISGGRVESTYRDGARWSQEALCYSERLGVPFVCEVKVFVTNALQSLRTCQEHGCNAPRLVLAGTNHGASARVIVARAGLLTRRSNSFERRASYLVHGDVVDLVGFQDDGAKLYFRFKYSNNGKKTDAWIDSDDVEVVEGVSR